MQYINQTLFTDELSNDDEIDILFGQLQQVEPPTSLVDSILASVASLPPLQPRRYTPWDGLEIFFVEEPEKQQLC